MEILDKIETHLSLNYSDNQLFDPTFKYNIENHLLDFNIDAFVANNNTEVLKYICYNCLPRCMSYLLHHNIGCIREVVRDNPNSLHYVCKTIYTLQSDKHDDIILCIRLLCLYGVNTIEYDEHGYTPIQSIVSVSTLNDHTVDCIYNCLQEIMLHMTADKLNIKTQDGFHTLLSLFLQNLYIYNTDKILNILTLFLENGIDFRTFNNNQSPIFNTLFEIFSTNMCYDYKYIIHTIQLFIRYGLDIKNDKCILYLTYYDFIVTLNHKRNIIKDILNDTI